MKLYFFCTTHAINNHIMKRITLLFFMLFLTLGVRGQFTEGFESSNLPDLTADTWNLGTTGLGSNGIWGVFDNGVGLTQSWKVAAGPAVVFAGNQAAFKDREGANPPGITQDYLATPLVTIPANGQLRFWARTGFLGNQGAQLKIMVAPATAAQNDVAAYSTIATFTEDQISNPFNVYDETVVSLNAFAGTQIYVAFVVEFNSPGPLAGDRWLIDEVRIVEQCLDPTALAAGSITQTSALLNWGNPSGATQWEIEIIPATGTPTGAGTLISTNPYLATATQPAGVPFTESTEYRYFVRAICDGGVTSEWVGPFTFSTSSPGLSCSAPIQITSLPYSTTDNTGNYGDTTDTAQPAACAGTATNYMTGNDVFYSYTPTTSGVISVTMTPQANWSGIFVYAGCDNVGVQCVAGVANTGSAVREIPNLAVTAGQTYIFVISTNASPQTVGYDLLIQQVNCPPPSGLSAIGVGSTQANLSWQNPGNATAWEVVVQPQGGLIPTGAGTPTTSNTNFAVTTTQDGTPLAVGCYQYWVRAACGDGTFSAWTGPFVFCLNNCASSCTYTFVMTDTFGDGWNGNTMNIVQGGVTVQTIGATFTDGAGPESVNVTLCDGPFSIFWNTGGSFANEVRLSVVNPFGQTIFTQPAGLTQGSTIFNGIADCANPLCLPPTNLTSSAVTTNGATLSWVPNGPAPLSWDIYAVPQGSPAPDAATVPTANTTSNPFTITTLDPDTTYVYYVRAVCDGEGANPWSEVSAAFTTLPTCPRPTNLAGTAVSQTSANLTWAAGGTETAWEVIVLPAGSPAPTGTTPGWQATTTPSFTWNDLTSGTAYDFYVRAVCAPDDISAVAGPGSFNTPICDPSNQCTYTFILEDSFGDGWNGNTMNVIQNGIVVAVIGSTFTTGEGPVEVQVPLCDDVPFSLFWNTGGSFATEVIVSIRNNFNQIIYTKPNNSGAQGTNLFTSTPDCQTPLCLPPTNLNVVSAGTTTATVGWTAGGAETTWQVIALPAAAPAPAPDATGWTVATTNPFTIEGLTAGTPYRFYVRAVCGPEDVSAWSAGFLFNTSVCDVANQCLYTFTLTDSFGDGWNGQTMSVIQGGITVATLGPQLTTGSGPVNVQVALCNGTPFSINWNTGGSFPNEIGLSVTSFLDEVVFTMPFLSASLQGTTIFTGTAECTLPTCPKPIELTVNNITETTALLGWTEQGTATQWEVIVLTQGSPVPGPDTDGTITSVNPILVSGLLPGTQYVFYVRAICGPDDVSFWSTVRNFSTLPANDNCAGAIFVPINSNSTCNQQVPGTFAGATASAVPNTCPGASDDDVWFQFVATNSYLNVSVAQVTGGADVNHAVYSGACEGLTLLYCSDANNSVANDLIVGQTYFVRVWTAGNTASTATFNLCVSTPSTCSNSPTVCNTTYTNTTGVTSLGQIGCLFTSPNPSYFTIQVVGSGPINFLLTQSSPGSATPNLDVDYAAWGPFASQAEVCAAIDGGQEPLSGLTTGCSYSAAPIENFNIANAQAGQYYVILITNFSNQPGVISLTQTNEGQPGAGVTFCCESPNFSYAPAIYCKTTSANPVATIADGSLAGTFSATPAGLTFANTATGEVDLANSAPGIYLITNTLPSTDSCNERTFSFTITIQEPATATFSYPQASYCSTVAGTIPLTFTGTPGGTFSSTTPGLFINPTTGEITPSLSAGGVYTVNYNLVSGGACINALPSTTVEIIVQPSLPDFADVAVCNSYTLPALLTGSYYSQPGGQGDAIPAGTVLTASQTVYVFAGVSPCSDEDSFEVNITPAPDVLPVDDVVTCGSYTLPALTVGNYYTGPGGTGTLLNANDVITSNQTIYIYAGSGDCSDEESFTVEIGSITADTLPNVTVCDSFVLPELSDNNGYFTQSGGQGQSLAEGSSVTSSQTIFIYAATGSCTAETSFTVTVNATPVVAEFEDVVSCGSYTLPALSVGTYYDAPGGTGNVLAAGASLTSSQTVYIWAQNGDCSDQSDFVVTITPNFTLDPIADVTACDSYTLPELSVGGYFTQSGGVGPLSEGAVITSSQTVFVYATQGLCTDEQSFVVTINTTPSFTLAGGCQNNAYVIEVIAPEGVSLDGATFAWSTIGGNLGTQPTDGASIEALADGEYTVEVSFGNCSLTQTFTAVGTQCTIQKGISVNGDGKNDFFDLEGQDVRQLTIFNRYGMKVYSLANYTNQWGGQGDNGEELPDGTYYYVIERRNGEGLTGWIYINRAQN